MQSRGEKQGRVSKRGGGARPKVQGPVYAGGQVRGRRGSEPSELPPSPLPPTTWD